MLQTDLTFFNGYPIQVTVDCRSLRIWLDLLPDKMSASVAKAMMRVIADMGNRRPIIYVDNGTTRTRSHDSHTLARLAHARESNNCRMIGGEFRGINADAKGRGDKAGFVWVLEQLGIEGKRKIDGSVGNGKLRYGRSYQPQGKGLVETLNRHSKDLLELEKVQRCCKDDKPTAWVISEVERWENSQKRKGLGGVSSNDVVENSRSGEAISSVSGVTFDTAGSVVECVDRAKSIVRACLSLFCIPLQLVHSLSHTGQRN
jgi:hypothetical protein